MIFSCIFTVIYKLKEPVNVVLVEAGAIYSVDGTQRDMNCKGDACIFYFFHFYFLFQDS